MREKIGFKAETIITEINGRKRPPFWMVKKRREWDELRSYIMKTYKVKFVPRNNKQGNKIKQIK